jgi:hypothetical protein
MKLWRSLNPGQYWSNCGQDTILNIYEKVFNNTLRKNLNNLPLNKIILKQIS